MTTIPPANGIPDVLKARAQWVAWKLEPRNGKPTKVPKSCNNSGGNADATDPTTWINFESAARHALEAGHEGIGFVFSEHDPYCGIDLDKCRDPSTGRIEPWAQTIIDDLDSYTETSPSGTGIHIILEGHKRGNRCRKGAVEIYDERRFFCMTGEVVGGHDSVEKRQAELDALYKSTFGNETHNDTMTPGRSGDSIHSPGRNHNALALDLRPPDAARKAYLTGTVDQWRAADLDFDATWMRRRQDFPSASEYDLSIASKACSLGLDAQVARDLIYLWREKEDEQLPKASRLDYLNRTFARAGYRNDAQRGDHVPQGENWDISDQNQSAPAEDAAPGDSPAEAPPTGAPGSAGGVGQPPPGGGGLPPQGQPTGSRDGKSRLTVSISGQRIDVIRDAWNALHHWASQFSPPILYRYGDGLVYLAITPDQLESASDNPLQQIVPVGNVEMNGLLVRAADWVVIRRNGNKPRSQHDLRSHCGMIRAAAV